MIVSVIGIEFERWHLDLSGISNPSASKIGWTRSGAVSILEASSIGISQIALRWEDVDGDAGYKVYRSTSQNGTYSQVGLTLGANATYFFDGTVKTANTSYWYKIETLDGFAASGVMSRSAQSRYAAGSSGPTSLRFMAALMGPTAYNGMPLPLPQVIGSIAAKKKKSR